MAYLALYRQFRPQGFDGLVGQDNIVRILKNQILSGRIGHAYLFCGARGTGKTSAAKIFARAINCLSPKPDGSPCNECEACRSLLDPSSMDILELDAASNNSVDDVRDMRDKIQYPPVGVKYKVYIVDEVHMLSASAFNALLKTIEEPPKHAVFIFATTEVHKLPQTILSRCMRFDFKLIPVGVIADLIKSVYDKIGKSYEPDAVTAIARAGRGSARDALSVADLCSSYSQGKLTYADVIDVLGSSDNGKLNELMADVLSADTGNALRLVSELAILGKNMSVLSADLSEGFRNVLIAKTVQNANSIICLPDNEFEGVKAMAELADNARLLRLIDIFSSLDNAFRYSSNPKMVLETAVVRACEPQNDYNIDALLSRITNLERAVDEGAVTKYKEVYIGINSPVGNAAAPTVAQSAPIAAPIKPVVAEVATKVEAAVAPKKAVPTEAPRADEASSDAPDESDGLFDDGFSEAPPEDDSAPFEYEAIKPISTPHKAAQPQISQPQPAVQRSSAEVKVAEATAAEAPIKLPPNKVWGRVLAAIRQKNSPALWTVLQEAEARVTEGQIKLIVESDSEYGYLARETNMAIINQLVAQYGDYSLKILRRGESGEEKKEFESDIEKVKSLFGEDIVKVK